MSGPCKNCNERKLYCHCECKKYLEFVEKLNRQKTLMRAEKALSGNSDLYVVRKVIK